MTLVQELKKKFENIFKWMDGMGVTTTFESLNMSGGVTVANRNGDVEIEGKVKSLKVNGKQVIEQWKWKN